MNYTWRLEQHQVLFKKHFRLEEYQLSHELFAGGESDLLVREIFERGAIAAVLPFDPLRRKVVLIEQFRAGAIRDPISPWLIQCVAGVVDAGESADATALRESREEAGCSILKLHKICQYYVSPGASTEECSLYCGIVDSEDIGGIHGLASENEDIRVEVVELESAFQRLQDGLVKSSETIIALQWLALNQQMLVAESSL